MGPSTARHAEPTGELESANVSPTDAGDLAVPHHATWDTDAGATNAKRVKEVKEVTRSLADTVSTALAEGTTPLAFGGDHSIAIDSLVDSARDVDIGVIWLDAHDGFSAPSTSSSGDIHGMPLAVALDIGDFADVEWANAAGLKEENVAIVGLCSVDDAEAEAARDSDMTMYTMSNIDERGIADVTNDTLGVAADGTDDVHINLDLGWLNPCETLGVGTPVHGGVTYREARAAMELVARSEAIRSFELVEVNPVLDEYNETTTLATELAISIFGKRIL